jgi:hypothetical protein
MSRAPFPLLQVRSGLRCRAAAQDGPQIVKSLLSIRRRCCSPALLALPSARTLYTRALPRHAPLLPHARTLFWNASSKVASNAKSDPSNVTAQIVWYQDLIKRGTVDKAALTELVRRFEDDAGLFKPASEARQLPLLASPEAWELYLKALVQIDQEAPIVDRVNSATQARAALLPALPASQVAETAAVEAAEPALNNEQIAQAVLSKNGTQTVKIASSPAYAGTTAASASSSKAAEPIRVIVEEAKGNLWFRAIRFLVVVALYSVVGFSVRAGYSGDTLADFDSALVIDGRLRSDEGCHLSWAIRLPEPEGHQEGHLCGRARLRRGES